MALFLDPVGFKDGMFYMTTCVGGAIQLLLSLSTSGLPVGMCGWPLRREGTDDSLVLAKKPTLASTEPTESSKRETGSSTVSPRKRRQSPRASLARNATATSTRLGLIFYETT
ncbi:duf1620 domain-containing protein [Moniliophthora roreri]|nr:duf1620 domain-containing protein [Moniliophthora roreri]